MTISIITATCNSASTIADCLASVNSQEVPVEHLIVDGASADDTLAIIRRHSPAARILSEPDKGIYDAMNKGIALATGEAVGILNSDDFYADKDVLARVAAVFADPAVDACYGDLVYVKDRSMFNVRCSTFTDDRSPVPGSRSRFQIIRYWKSGEFSPEKFYWGWMPPHPTFFVRRRVYEQYGLFNLALGSAADYELMLRFLLKHRIRTVYIPQVLVTMRAGGVSNASFGNRLRANRMDREAWRVNGLKPHPWTLFMKPVRKIPQWLTRPAV